MMVHDQNITVANAKQIMHAIVDGDTRMPGVIAEEQGFIGGVVTTDEVRHAVQAALADPSNAAVVEKILGGNTRPIMSLVGRVMKAINRRGDPVVIKKLLEDEIASKSAGGWTAPVNKTESDE